VEVFREVWRVLRDDGVVWINIGESRGANYRGGGPRTASAKQLSNAGSQPFMGRNGYSDGDRLGIPERLILALQLDGWTWRDTVIWAKKSPMPESVAGTRWEPCRVKVGGQEREKRQAWGEDENGRRSGVDESWLAQWAPCPGCPKCQDSDGLVLRRGSWRTTVSHDYIYMLTKGLGYYADGEAVKTAGNPSTGWSRSHVSRESPNGQGNGELGAKFRFSNDNNGANRRSVWSDIRPEPYGGPHFATFPSDLPRLCIQASTSERGCCPECGAQWARVVERTSNPRGDAFGHKDEGALNHGQEGSAYNETTTRTIGWRATCHHDADPVPCTVLDPFCGTGTTALAAQRLGHRAVGVDLSEDYLNQAVKRLSAETLPLLGAVR